MSEFPRVLLVGPLPPPSGGMANQTRQLARLLESEGVPVRIVRSNAPYRPGGVARLRGVRALVRLIVYVWTLLASLRDTDVVHVMANSGWSWHLVAAPAIRLSAMRGVPVLVNYRGGLAEGFLRARAASVRSTLHRSAALVVPSGFLKEVFARHGMTATVIPNVVDTVAFRPATDPSRQAARIPHLVVARNLEQLYGNDLAIRALARLRKQYPHAHLTIAGSGPELESLQALARELAVSDAVTFTGRLETEGMAALYRDADVVVNPTRADNMPNSILEALASGVPVVSTRVGGVPYLVEHGRTAWLVQPESPDALAEGIVRILDDATVRRQLVMNGLELARDCAWEHVRERWLGLYQALARSSDSQERVVYGRH